MDSATQFCYSRNRSWAAGNGCIDHVLSASTDNDLDYSPGLRVHVWERTFWPSPTADRGWKYDRTRYFLDGFQKCGEGGQCCCCYSCDYMHADLWKHEGIWRFRGNKGYFLISENNNHGCLVLRTDIEKFVALIYSLFDFFFSSHFSPTKLSRNDFTSPVIMLFDAAPVDAVSL